ncbi:MAG: tRNA pseudouridine(55) synthase TruB [Parachlamydia sp.]|nr:tRNA pseudouridine(55) synthase TruB [Parachlamydia sp.]
MSFEGLLLVNKPSGKTSFSLVSTLRKLLNVRKIGHAGTLDPFATGVMVMLIGKNYTRLSDQMLCQDKEYLAEVHLGIATDTYDCDGKPTSTSPLIPTLEEIESALAHFQGEIEQQPPMFSAKKIQGKKLYELARKGKTIERPSAKVYVSTHFLNYSYPYLTLRISCSKGTYIRSIAHDLGISLGCGAHLSALQRLRSGTFRLEDCIDGSSLVPENLSLISQALRK